MKMPAKRIGFVLVVLLYLFTVYNYNKNIFYTNAVIHSGFSEVSYVDSDEKNNPFNVLSNQTQITSLVEGFNNIPTPVRKSHSLNSFERSNPLEYIEFIAFSKFIFYSSRKIIQFQQTDISFPFHQFS